MNRDILLTDFSKREWDIIVETDMNPPDVTHYFYENMKIRDFGELLECYSDCNNVKELLIDKLCGCDKEVKHDSVRRKVSNWLSGQNQPTDRDELIKICFALELDEIKAQNFMSFSFDDGFHLRNPREVAFMYCIRTHKTYPEALRFTNNLKPIEDSIERLPILTYDIEENKKNDEEIIYTKVVACAFANVYNDDAFCKFYGIIM